MRIMVLKNNILELTKQKPDNKNLRALIPWTDCSKKPDTPKYIQTPVFLFTVKNIKS